MVPDGDRRLAAIMFTDVVGYTSLTQNDEYSTLQALEKHRSLLRPLLSSHGGREIKTIGDAFLVEFQSALDAVLCAAAVQQVMHDRKVARGEPFSLRIGIHVGDVIESGNDILGDAVNIASRIEPLSEPGGVCISGQVYDQVRNKSGLSFVSLGERSLKNVSTPVQVYAAQMPWEQSAKKEEAVLSRDRIAILPFANMSPDPSDEYFADGMTEEIISTVSGISGLSVISRTSVMHYKKTEKTLKEIGRELEVGSVLEGSFRKAGNRIRVTTQLIDVAGDRHIWAQNYDRNLDDVFEVQSDVAKHVAEALRIKILSPEKERIERKPTESTAAYTLYLKGRFLWNRRGLDDLKTAREYFERAVEVDSDFAPAYVGVADCSKVLRIDWGIDRDSNLERAKAMVAEALRLDPDLAEAHATEGSLLYDEYSFRESEEEFRKAIDLKPNYPTTRQWYLWILMVRHRWDEARAQIEKALEVDPLSPILIINYGGYFYYKRDYARSLELVRRALELGLSYAHLQMADTFGRLKEYESMRREYADHVEAFQSTFPGVRTFTETMIAYYEGDRQKVLRMLPDLGNILQQTNSGTYGLQAVLIGELYIALGETERGFEWLQRSYSRHEGYLPFITIDPEMDGVRTDPRYTDLLKRLGLD